MDRPLELRWGLPARALGLALLAASLALAAWSQVRPGTPWTTRALGGALALFVLAQVAAMFHFRARVDKPGLTRRALRGSDALAWDDVEAAILVATTREGGAIVHARTRDPEAAFHLLLYPRGGGRRWHFNAWMTDFRALARAASDRGLVTLARPGAAAGRAEVALVGAARRLDALNHVGGRVQVWFALAFTLFVAGVTLVAGLGVWITGDVLVDLVLVGLALLAAVYGLSIALRAVGARRYAERGALAPARSDWPMTAASLIGGALLVAGFLPRAIGGEVASPWLDAIFAAVGALLIYVSLRGWLRGE